VLLEVAQRLLQGRRKADLVVRLGGDEFVVLLHHPGDDAGAASQVAQQCIEAIRRPIRALTHTLELGVSIGIAHQPRGESTEFLLIQADTAMYAAKHSGRNRYCTYDPGMRQSASPAPHTNDDKPLLQDPKMPL
jgi:diguanylate cyclase (GGDEF)-like protein